MIGEPRLSDLRADLEWHADMTSDVADQVGKVSRFINAVINVHAACIGKCCFEFFKW
jgi:hypothetical protein